MLTFGMDIQKYCQFGVVFVVNPNKCTIQSTLWYLSLETFYLIGVVDMKEVDFENEIKTKAKEGKEINIGLKIFEKYFIIII